MGLEGTTSQKMLLGYEKSLADGEQLWAYVAKTTHVIQDAGINIVPRVWSNEKGFVLEGVTDMELDDLVYSAMRNALIAGAKRKQIPYFNDDDSWSAVGTYIIESERYVGWEDGCSFDPTVLEVFRQRFSQYFEGITPDADNTFEFVKTYLAEQESLFNFSYQEGSSELLDAFNAGIDLEAWRDDFQEYAVGLASLKTFTQP